MSKTGIVFSGGVSLGTYESGVGAAFLHSVYASGKPRIKAISGASAGAVTSFMTGYALHRGISPYALCALWEDYADIRKLTQNARCVLSLECIRAGFRRLMSISKQCQFAFNSNACRKKRGVSHCKGLLCNGIAKHDIVSIIEMTALEGYAAQNSNMNFRMHNDNFRIDFSKLEHYDIERVMDTVISSTAIPFIFPAISIKKKKDEFKYKLSGGYEKERISINYADGGLTDNLPFMSVFNEGGISEIYLVMPHPFNAMKLVKHANEKNGYKPIQNQLTGLWKAYNASSYQSLYHDMQNYHRINRIIDGLKKLKENAQISDETYVELKCITETENKHYSEMHIISPKSPESMLSGEIMSHFGGFFRKDIREWDFTAGYMDAYSAINEKYPLDAPLFKRSRKDLGSIKTKHIIHNRFFLLMILRAAKQVFIECFRLLWSLIIKRGG